MKTLEIVPAGQHIDIIDVKPVTQIGAASPEATKGKRYVPRTVEWNEEIYVAPLRTRKMKAIPGEMGVFAISDDTFLGRYARAENFLSNAFLLSLFEDGVNSMGLEFTRKISTGDYGARLFAVYTFPTLTFVGPDGRKIALQIRIENSYNGTCPVRAAIEALRLICLNGMMGLSTVFSLAKRHSAQLDVPSIVQTLTPQIDSGLVGLAAPMQKMIDAPLSDDAGLFLLRNLFKANPAKFSGLMARKIETAWQNPTEDERDSHSTVWGLYNSGTRIFRDLETEKTALVNRVAPYYTGALIGVTEKPDWAKRLSVPVSFEDAYKRDAGEE